MNIEKSVVDNIMYEIEGYIYDSKWHDVRDIIEKYIEQQTPTIDITMSQFQQA